MAHKEGHKKVTGWLPDAEADQLEILARANERSVAAELRLAIRAHLMVTQTAALAAASQDGDTAA